MTNFVDHFVIPGAYSISETRCLTSFGQVSFSALDRLPLSDTSFDFYYPILPLPSVIFTVCKPTVAVSPFTNYSLTSKLLFVKPRHNMFFKC